MGKTGRAALPPLGIVRLEARALLVGRSELMIAVGKFDAVAIELKALRGARIVGIQACQRRLRGRISVHKGESMAAEAGSHLRRHHEVE